MFYIYVYIYIHTYIHTHTHTYTHTHTHTQKERERGFPSVSVVKNLPAMQEPQETWVRSLSWEDSPEEGIVTHSSILAWRIPMDRRVW